MKISNKGLEFIQQWEGLKLKAYPDPATGGIPWTIGYGHTKDVKPGQVITEQQAEA
ncbi:lysozyme, partial [Xenorhabdus bovienii]